MIDHKAMKDIDHQKRELLKEIALPTNENFENYHSVPSQARSTKSSRKELKFEDLSKYKGEF